MIIGVYGSLKEGYYNHIDRWFKKAKKIKTIRLKGYDLYDIGYFPAAVGNRENKTGIVVELWDVNNIEYREMRAMELGAGYREITQVQDGQRFQIWIYDRIPKTAVKIEDNEWKDDFKFDNFEIEFDKDFDTALANNEIDEFEEELLELIVDDPELVLDPDIENYINLNPEFKRKVDALDLEDDFDDSWLNDIDNEDELDYNFRNTIDLDDSDDRECECTKRGTKGSWEYDNLLKAWRCTKCGIMQEDE